MQLQPPHNNLKQIAAVELPHKRRSNNTIGEAELQLVTSTCQGGAASAKSQLPVVSRRSLDGGRRQAAGCRLKTAKSAEWRRRDVKMSRRRDINRQVCVGAVPEDSALARQPARYDDGPRRTT